MRANGVAQHRTHLSRQWSNSGDDNSKRGRTATQRSTRTRSKARAQYSGTPGKMYTCVFVFGAFERVRAVCECVCLVLASEYMRICERDYAVRLPLVRLLQLAYFDSKPHLLRFDPTPVCCLNLIPHLCD